MEIDEDEIDKAKQLHAELRAKIEKAMLTNQEFKDSGTYIYLQNLKNKPRIVSTNPNKEDYKPLWRWKHWN